MLITRDTTKETISKGHAATGRAVQASMRSPFDLAEELLTQSQVATLLNVSEGTLESWRARRLGPKFISYSARCVRYRLADVQEWLRQHEVETAGEARA
jgi:hypothetical protein